MLVLVPSLFIDSRVRDPCLSDPRLHLPLLVLQSFRIETVRIEADERIKIQSVGFGFDKALTSYLLMIPALSTDSPFQRWFISSQDCSTNCRLPIVSQRASQTAEAYRILEESSYRPGTGA